MKKPIILASDKLQAVKITNVNKFRVKVSQDETVANDLIRSGIKTIDTFWLSPNDTATLIHNYVQYSIESSELFSIKTEYLDFDLR